MAAVELANAYVTIVPSLKGATKQITSELSGVDTSKVGSSLGRQMSSGMAAGLNMQSIGRQIQTLGGGIQNVGGALAKNITAPAAVAGGAVAGMVATFGWGRLKSVDSARAQLKGLGYSAEDVERISGQLVDALEGGMLTMGEATSAAAAGMAAGVSEGKELTRYIQLLDAATAGSNGTFDEMNQIFARIQGSGKLMTSELDMIEQRMPGFSGAAAEAFGVTQEELRKMVSEGKVSSDQFLDVMDGFAGDMATEYAKSWEGMVQNTKAYVGIVGETMLGGVFEQSKGAIAEFIEYLKSDDVAAWAESSGAVIGDAFSKILNGIKSAITWWNGLDASQQKMIGSLGGIAVAAGPVLMVVGRIVSGIGGLVSMGGQFVSWLGAGSAGAKMLGGALRFLMGPWGLLIAGITAAVASSPELQAMLGQLVTTIGGALMQVLQALMPIFQTLADAVLPIVSAGVQLLSGLLAQIIPVISQLVTAIAPLVTELIGSLLPVFQQIVAAVQPIINALMPALITAFEAVGSAVKTVFSALAPIIEGALTIVSGIVQTITAAIRGDWSGVWEGIKTIFSGVWNTIKAIVTGAIRIVASVIGNTIEAISGVWNAVWGAVKDFFSSVWQSIVNAAGNFGKSVQDKFTAVTDFIGSIPATVLDFFAGIGTWLLDSGKALIQGFLDGIMAGFNTAKQWVSDGLGAIRDLFPFSPAKEGPFSGRGWVAYSGLSLGSTFTQSVADSLHDGRKDVEDELGGIQERFDQFDGSTSFRVGSAVPAFASGDGAAGRGFTFNSYNTDPLPVARAAYELFRGRVPA